MSHSEAFALQQLLNIIVLASFYAPLAVAFALIQALTKKVFLSFGDFAMFGSIAAIYMAFGRLLYGDSDLTISLLSLGAAIVCSAALGQASARLVFVPMMKSSSLAFMIAALGFSIAIQELMRIVTDSRDVWVPPLFQGQNFQLGTEAEPVYFTSNRLLAVVISMSSLVSVFALVLFTSFGRQWRACAQNHYLAALCGINATRIAEITFILGTGLAAVSGWMTAITYGGTNFAIGIMLGFKAMFAAVAGGFGNLLGALLGAIALATLEVVWSVSFGSTYRDVGVFAIIIVILFFKPEGLGNGIASREQS